MAAVLVGLVVLLSAAPCTGIAGPAGAQARVSAPSDPCQARHAAPATACAQLACQLAAEPPFAWSAPAPALSSARFDPRCDAALGRDDAPPLPPPRLPMS
ncbi:MAG TPA: hypothetical protein VIE16_04790 [Phenylobacterium sp.]